MNHKDLLKKYMIFIISREGRDFVDETNPEYEPEIEFSYEEFKELAGLSHEIEHGYPPL